MNPLLLVMLVLTIFMSWSIWANVKRQRKETMRLTELNLLLKRGDRVITTSGLYATVVGFDDDTVDLEVAEDVVTTWARKVLFERVSLDDLPAEVDEDDDEALEGPEGPLDSAVAEALEKTEPRAASETQKD